MKLYDLTFWIKISEDPKNIEEKILKLIENLGGKIEMVIPSKKRNLAYPIMKESVGYLGTVFFSAQPEVSEKLNSELKKFPEILRFLIVKRKTLPKSLPSKEEVELGKIETSSAQI